MKRPIIQITLLDNPTGIKSKHDNNETIVSYDSTATKHDGCVYTVPGYYKLGKLTGNVLELLPTEYSKSVEKMSFEDRIKENLKVIKK